MKEVKFIDIHTHIIPDVDDGSKTFSQSLQMLEEMILQGVTDVIATPHINSTVTRTTREKQVSQYYILKQRAKDLKINLHLGAEVKYIKYLITDYHKNKIENTNYILMEFSWEKKDDVHGVLKELKEEGFKPIVAHVERYSYLTLEDYKKLKADGILLQVNTNAVLGTERELWTKNANILLSERLVDFIATDAHNTENRAPNIKEAYQYLTSKLEQDYLDDIFYNNALKIINSKK